MQFIYAFLTSSVHVPLNTEFLGSTLTLTSRLKGHSQLCDRADLDTAFASLKSVYLNPKSKLRVGYI